MSTGTHSDALADLEKVLRPERPDPELIDRIRERSRRVQEEMRGRLGTIELAVPLLREARAEA